VQGLGSTAGVVQASGSYLAYGDGTGLRVLNSAANGAGSVASVAGENAGISLSADLGPIAFSAGGGEQMRLTSTGLGIGTSSPAARLSVITASANSTAATIGGIEYSGSKRGLTIKTYQSVGGDDCGVEFNAANGLSGYGAFKFVADTTTLATLDATGNLGLGVTPSAWGSNYKSLDINTRGASLGGGVDALALSVNAYFDGAWKYKGSTSLGVTRYEQYDGAHYWSTGTSGTAGDPITFTQAMTLTAAGNLLVGTTTARNRLTVQGTVVSTPTLGTASGQAFFGEASGYGMMLGTSGFGYGWIQQQRIDGSATPYDLVLQPVGGNVGIGTTSPAAKLHVNGTTLLGAGTWPTGAVALSGSRVALLSNTEDQILIIANTESTVGADKGGEILMGAKATTGTEDATVARIGGFKESAASGNSASYLRFRTSISNGDTFERMRLTSEGYLRMASGSGGIQFNGDTAAANALDDYEEGTWTPGVSFGGGTTGITFVAQDGRYTKIGRQVTVTASVTLSSKGSSSGDAVLTGLPFTNNSARSAGSIYIANITFADYPSILLEANNTIAYFRETTNAGVTTDLTNADFSNDSFWTATITYFV
jgi:hypothetical protein